MGCLVLGLQCGRFSDVVELDSVR